MDSRSILQILREHEPELKAAGIAHLRVFGSTARNQASEQSDIDLLADFNSPTSLTLVTVGRLQSRLADLLGTHVDLSSTDWMRPRVRKHALEEAILAF